MEAEPTKRKRRWFQFSLRTLLVFTLVCAIGSAWVAHRMVRKRKERETVETIIRFGGRVYDDYQEEVGEAPVFDPEPSGPVWMRKLLGENFFSEVVGVSLPSYPVNTPTDAELRGLRGLTQLQLLDLASTYITDVGLVNLNGFIKLQTLDLRQTNVGDGGLTNLEGLTQLQTLNLWETKVTDVGLTHLKGLTQLKTLVLQLTNVTDVGVTNLRGLTQLEVLVVSATNVTDAGLANLKGLSKLRFLDLRWTNVSDAGVNELQKALPNCKIYR